MKKVLKPATKEEAVYYSDFSGKCFDQHGAPAVLNLEFNYGSKYDTGKITLHLTDKESEEVINFLKQKLNKDCIDTFKKMIYHQEVQYNEAMDFRDWNSCERIACSGDLLKKLTE